MVIGIPKEIKSEETGVTITPSGVSALTTHGHRVLVETQAGAGSSIPDTQYEAAGPIFGVQARRSGSRRTSFSKSRNR